jgi:hypothetical protein
MRGCYCGGCPECLRAQGFTPEQEEDSSPPFGYDVRTTITNSETRVWGIVHDIETKREGSILYSYKTEIIADGYETLEAARRALGAAGYEYCPWGGVWNPAAIARARGEK